MAAAMVGFSPAFPTSSPLSRANCTGVGTDQTPERYLELATDCVERVQRMRPGQVNRGLCQYLAIKLKLAVQQARECLTILQALECLVRSLSVEIMKPGVEIFKQLVVSAAAVERFIHGWCEDEWLGSALTMANASEVVSMLGYDLDFLRAGLQYSILRNDSGAEMLALAELAMMFGKAGYGRKAEDDIIRLRARLDRNRLLEKTQALVQSSEVGDREKRPLAAYLLRRLTAAMAPAARAEVYGSGGSSPLNFWKMDYHSLEPRDSLGIGTAGIVHRTEWLGVVVAEMTFFGSDPAGFEKEVSSLAGLCHPNVVSLLGYATGDGDCSLVMELMDGDLFGLMRTRMRRDRSLKAPFTISQAVDIMLQIAQGVTYLHEHSVAHRDLKARNILVRSVGTDVYTGYVHAKVADFGLAKTKLRSSTYLNQTERGGRARWMAPELMALEDPGVAPSQANASYLWKSDVYSFGMVCYEIVTGKVPFHATSSPDEVKRMVLEGHRPALSDGCPVRLKAWIERCWDPEASCRPSFGEICAELRRLKFMQMIGGDVDGCEGTGAHRHAQHSVPPRASPAATPLERGSGFAAGTRLPLYGAIHRLLEMHPKWDVRAGNVGGDVENCEPVLHDEVCERQAFAILRRALGSSFASRSWQPDLDATRVWRVDKGWGRFDDLVKRGSRRAVKEVGTKKSCVPHAWDAQTRMLFDWYNPKKQEPRMHAEVAAGFEGAGCLKQVSCSLKHA